MNTFKFIGKDRHRIAIDGDGVTTLVLLSGCPLSCAYCINKHILNNNNADKIYEITPEELWEQVEIDYCYFIATGGGITFGGGEPLLQSKAIKEFSNIIPNDININIETSLNVEQQSLEDVINIVKLFIIDIKDIDSDIYKRYTSKDNINVINNLKYIAKMNKQGNCIIRLPLIPNYNSTENINSSINWLKSIGFQRFNKFNYIIQDYM